MMLMLCSQQQIAGADLVHFEYSSRCHRSLLMAGAKREAKVSSSMPAQLLLLEIPVNPSITPPLHPCYYPNHYHPCLKPRPEPAYAAYSDSVLALQPALESAYAGSGLGFRHERQWLGK